MLAFLGAVICIIASVYPGSSTPAHLPLADNQSLAPDAPLQSLSPGSVAHAGSLGALHGSESTESGGVGVSLEAPTLNELSNSGGIGSGGRKQFSFSRLICTPIPVGECKTNNLQQQADEPSSYSAEDLGYFRTTAEQLRQTVLQQKDQILMDQRTIRELTGKLSECESGLEERSAEVERSVGMWGDNRRLMAGDDVHSLALAQMQTARAVEELERAILQLKDRIEKLESELGPLAHNLSEMSLKGLVGISGAPRRLGETAPWRVEDLEGELERKIDQLEKERATLRKQSQSHHQEIDQGISTLHHRIAQLEQSLSEYDYPDGFKLSFPLRTNYMYGKVKRAVPEMHALTACLWLRAREGGIGTPFSYSVAEQPNELVLLQGLHSPVELLISDKVAQLPLSLPPDSWQHVCISWTLRDGVWKAYQGGLLKGGGEGLAAWHPIRAGGVLILGQEQDTLGGRFDASQALVGALSQFNLWDRVLTPAEVSGLAQCSRASLGNVVPWTNRDVEVHGGAIKEPRDPCAERANTQP
ncbi:hypothetical protein COCON_G00024880 [Conger conger]|uniref:Pentraxin (PTX) domain-containing protein n=2 Tax=Teleostei TaxID=32443 RepID=A0A9Q1DXM9_CONCO|nr:neuronal pentraxin receptor b [Conger conger]KAJ8283638.1 hypothetical protein COCON_G00024880 [Conger conger]